MAPKQTPKPVFKTATPFTETKWPHINQDEQDVILDLVCNLVAPLGEHRRTHSHASKGKKRKRTTNPDPKDESTTLPDAPPPPPDISQHILIGLNAITRHLEALAARNAPTTLAPSILPPPSSPPSSPPPPSPPPSSPPPSSPPPPSPPPTAQPNINHPALILLTHPNPSSSPAHAHLPTLLHIATLSSPTTPTTKTRLVPLPTSTDPRLASYLGIPRVAALAIMQDAPGAQTLVEYVRSHVDVTECPWVDEAMAPRWKGANVRVERSGGGV
ncbi:hypothetical protein IAQ61_007136 [Plenodomus lingam]|uniref:uncharacterized protein n=1 Tax=Leptosphaeria maculans TaxID=5022 RepID=UPI00332BC19F|nr:hypothetical protein IAQ61_007136 [Plenodomus lingam]